MKTTIKQLKPFCAKSTKEATFLHKIYVHNGIAFATDAVIMLSVLTTMDNGTYDKEGNFETVEINDLIFKALNKPRENYKKITTPIEIIDEKTFKFGENFFSTKYLKKIQRFINKDFDFYESQDNGKAIVGIGENNEKLLLMPLYIC